MNILKVLRYYYTADKMNIVIGAISLTVTLMWIVLCPPNLVVTIVIPICIYVLYCIGRYRATVNIIERLVSKGKLHGFSNGEINEIINKPWKYNEEIKQLLQ
jgi:MFS superfamily sulfate permease-like transporter